MCSDAHSITLKKISIYFSIDYFYIDIYSKKYNAKINKIIKTVGHRARYFRKNYVEHTLLWQQF